MMSLKLLFLSFSLNTHAVTDTVPVPNNHVMDKVFIKTEVPPTFPGGDSAWQNYLQKFYSDNKKLIRQQAPATIWVQFIVAFDGQISQVTLITDDSRPKLGDLVIRLIQEGPNWIPATQNGHKVSCYQKQKVEFK